MFFEYQVIIDSRDVDGSGRCRPSALLGHLQEVATLAAEDGGFGRAAMLEEANAFWMVVRMWYSLRRPLRWRERLTIRTWHRGGKSAQCYRDFDLYAGEEHVGEAVSVWVLADLSNRRLRRLRSVRAIQGTDGGPLCKEKLLSKLRMPKEMRQAERRLMRYSDTDINGHVNNTRYADFACDALGLESLPKSRFLSQMQLDYTRECRPGELLSLLAMEAPEGSYVKGVDEDGKTRFETAMIFGDVL